METQVIGGTVNQGNAASDCNYAHPITIDYDGYLQSIGINWANALPANVRVGIYLDDGGKPGTLLYQSESVAANLSAGWQDVAIVGQITSGLKWIVWTISSEKGINYISSERCYYYSAYGPFPDSWPGTYTHDYLHMTNMRVIYYKNEDKVSSDTGSGSEGTVGVLGEIIKDETGSGSEIIESILAEILKTETGSGSDSLIDIYKGGEYVPRKTAFDGYRCFIEQYVKNKVIGALPWKLPDGTKW